MAKRGRKELSENDKRKQIQISIKNSKIEQLGGIKQVKQIAENHLNSL